MRERLVWANVMRPRLPLVYLDLNSVIMFARLRAAGPNVPDGYRRLLASVLSAKVERRAMFPLGEGHLWEVSKLKDPQQRIDLTEVLEEISDFNYLLGRVVIAELEFEAGIAKILDEDISTSSLPLVRPTMGQVLGMRGGLRVRDEHGRDVTDEAHTTTTDADFVTLMATMNREFERRILAGPSDEDLAVLRQDPAYRPEQAIAVHQSAVDFEKDTQARLDQHPHWRRGRLRDMVSAREIVHEWLDMLNRIRTQRVRDGLEDLDQGDDRMRDILGAMPHTQVAVSLKTRLHQNPQHQWTPNHIVDIDAMSVAYAYCEAVFPDKEMRSALVNSKELRVIPTFVARRPEELAEWLDALPLVSMPDFWVPHPLPRPD